VVVFNQAVEQGRAMSTTEGPAEDRLSKVFAALADPTRRELVSRLAADDATLTELAEPHDMSIQAVSKHLKVLEDAGLVRRTREAQRRPAHLEAEVLELMTGWIERRRREYEERYQRLDSLLDRMADEDDSDDNDSHSKQDRRRGAAS
jgi:DNA-binding transcriptional ArsR family regulator